MKTNLILKKKTKSEKWKRKKEKRNTMILFPAIILLLFILYKMVPSFWGHYGRVKANVH